MYEVFEELLNLKKVTPYQISKETGISQSTLSDWKRGRSTPKQDKLQIIADYFGVTVDFLLGRTDDIYCSECGIVYNPLNEDDNLTHIKYHSRWAESVKKYGFCWNVIQADTIKSMSNKIINDNKSSKESVINAYENKFKAEYSDLLRENGFNLSLDYNAYCSRRVGGLFLSSYSEDDFLKDIIVELKKIYGLDLNNLSNSINDDEIIENGLKIDVFENINTHLAINQNMFIGTEHVSYTDVLLGELYGLKINDHSMEPNICKNDIVIFCKQDFAKNGDIIIVRAGNEVLCRQLIEYQDSIRLIPFNPSNEPKFFSNDDVESFPVTIIGKVIESRRKYKDTINQ